jgi:hypothetical protein
MIVTAAHVIAKEDFWGYGGLADQHEEVDVGGRIFTAAVLGGRPSF